ncbi:MAG: TIGR00730 family Rossman fold protein, partial [Clostridia bacterium]|nr:TIGR00730 family Rossman fold protein [Clostridia bacterium]
GASNRIDQSYIEATKMLGEKMAKRGHNLVFGAGGTGLMGAIAEGVSKGGGKVTGVIPSFFLEINVEVVSDHCDEVIYTETMRERKQTMEDLSDAFIMTPGGIGTFEEFFEILTLKQLGQLNKPIVIFNYNNYYVELLDMMDHSIERKFINEGCSSLYSVFEDADKLIDFIEKDEGNKLTVNELKN